MKMKYVTALVVGITVLACVLSAAALPPAGPEPHFVSSPAVKSAEEHSVVIEWNTNIPSNSLVIWGTTTTDVSKQVEGSNGAAHHEVTVSGLQPGTTYYFKAQSGTNTSCGVRSFTTTKPGEKFRAHVAPVVVKCVAEPAKKK